MALLLPTLKPPSLKSGEIWSILGKMVTRPLEGNHGLEGIGLEIFLPPPPAIRGPERKSAVYGAMIPTPSKAAMIAFIAVMDEGRSVGAAIAAACVWPPSTPLPAQI